jgi:hypothetical protein
MRQSLLRCCRQKRRVVWIFTLISEYPASSRFDHAAPAVPASCPVCHSSLHSLSPSPSPAAPPPPPRPKREPGPRRSPRTSRKAAMQARRRRMSWWCGRQRRSWSSCGSPSMAGGRPGEGADATQRPNCKVGCGTVPDWDGHTRGKTNKQKTDLYSLTENPTSR